MLNIPGPASRYCDGITRRNLLRLGTFAFGANVLSLPQILRADEGKSSHKSLINIFLGGGPPHQDLWEIKTSAPQEIRGPMMPIATSVPGIEICEVFPNIAKLMEDCTVIRSVVGATDRHEAFQTNTGWHHNDLRPIGGRPSIGSVVSKIQGPVDRSLPPFVGLAQRTQHVPWSDAGTSGFLGAAYLPFKPDGEGMDNMKLNGITADRLSDRKSLLTAVDNLKRACDANGMMEGMDAFSQRAFDVLTSSKLLDALDLSKEDPEIVARYGDGKPYQFQYDGAPTVNDQLLMARRLVEAGVRVVTISFGRWDSHGDNFGLVRDHGSKLDQCLGALISDLKERGMLDNVTIAVWGEFGRTPRINQGAGRDHWPQVSCALLAGGGMRNGQAIGATNRLGEYAKERPVHIQEIVATLYRNLGLDPTATTLIDPTGRPQYLTQMNPLKELVG